MRDLLPVALISGFALAAALGIGLFFQSSYQNQAQHVAQQNLIALDVAYRATVTMHSLDVETRLKSQVLRDEVLDLVEQANAASDEALPAVRGWLYRALRHEYQDMVHTGLRQLHFHFPDGRSLLRFHSPSHLDDPSLFEVRPSLRIANTELRPVTGFEGGRVLPGFRNVFPILREGRHLGSVEFSLPFELIHQHLSGLLPEGDYALLLHRDTVSMVFEDQIEKFVSAGIHPDYFKENPVISETTRNFVRSTQAGVLNDRLGKDMAVQLAMAAGDSFAVPVLYEGKGFIASFLGIRDLRDQHAAYLAGFVEAPVLLRIRDIALRDAIMSLLLLLLLSYSGWHLVRGQQRLGTEKRRLQTITESMIDGMYVVDKKGVIVFANETACAITGYAREALLNADARELLRLDDPPKEPSASGRQSIGPASCAGAHRDGEYWYTHRDGHRFPVDVSCRPMLEQGRTVGQVVLFRDMSAQRETLQRLRLQSAALDASANAIVITNAAATIEWANPAFTDLTGYSLAEAIGRKPKELIRSGMQSVETYREMWQTILAGKPWHGELINKRKNGSLYHEELTITPLLDRTGTISHFIAVKQDISARKAEETAAARARIEIEQLSARNELLLNSAGDGIYGTDTQGLCVFINPAALHMLGYRLEDLLYQDSHRLFHYQRINGDAYPHVECPIHLTLRDGQRRDIEDAFVRSSGEHFDVHMSVTATYADGKVSGTVVVFQDITQRKRLEAELNQLASTDTLTGIANRRQFLECLAMELDRVRRYPGPLSLLMLDLDLFKGINDRYGHAAGDQVLRHFTNQVQHLLRKVDIFGRLGGEEFGILLPDTDLNGATEIAERLRRRIAETPCLCVSHPIAYTVSIGVVDCDMELLDADNILARADRALYSAKAAGRNRIMTCDPAADA